MEYIIYYIVTLSFSLLIYLLRDEDKQKDIEIIKLKEELKVVKDYFVEKKQQDVELYEQSIKKYEEYLESIENEKTKFIDLLERKKTEHLDRDYYEIDKYKEIINVYKNIKREETKNMDELKIKVQEIKCKNNPASASYYDYSIIINVYEIYIIIEQYKKKIKENKYFIQVFSQIK